jgi:hypothetical protein
MVINRVASSFQFDAADITDDQNLGTALESHVSVPMSVSQVGVFTSKSTKGIDPITFSKKWGISPEKAQRTVRTTTQRGVRTVLHPSLSRRFRTNDHNLRYRRLPHDMFSDTMFAGTVSVRGNTCA